MTASAPQRKDPLLFALMALVILSSTFVFTVVGDAPQTAILVILGLAVSAVIRAPLGRTTRSYVYTTLVALVAAVGQHEFAPAYGDRFFLMPGDAYCPMLLYMAVVLTLFEARESVVASVVSLAFLATMIAGNVISFDPRESPNLKLVLDLEQFHVLYGWAVLCQTLATIALLARAVGIRVQDPFPRRGLFLRAFVFSACLATAAALGMGMRFGAMQFQRRFQSAMTTFLQRYSRQQRDASVFSREVDLWRTSQLRSQGDQTIVLRVHADRPPGYMRGYVYRDYRNGRWESAADGVPMQALPAPGGHITIRSYRRYALPVGNRLERMDVMPARGFRSQVLLAPGDAAQVELIAPELRNSQDGELAFGGWDATTGYVAVVPSRAGESAYPGPNGPDFDPTPYLRVPAYLRAPLAQVTAEAFSGLPEDAGMPRTVAALMAYFNDNFEYALGVGMDDVTMDPALQFLTRWKRGHCELFATSTVLLLRSRGIPARYVTGFVCSERPPGSRHYVARLQNAHAWAEAYDEESGTWHLVEGTPASGVPSGVSDASLAWSLWDSLKLAWQRMLALMKRGYVAQAIAGFVMGIGSGIVSLFATPVRALLTIAVVAVVLGWLASRRHRRRQGLMREVGAGRWLLFRSRDRLLKRFRKVGLQPAPGDTMRHLLARLAGGSPEHAARLAPAIGEYERLRYGPEQPTKEEVKAFDRRLREVLSSCRTRSTRAGDAGSTKGVPAAES